MTDKRDISGLDLSKLRDVDSEDAGGTLDGVAGQAPTPAHDAEAAPRRDTLASVAGDEVAGEAAALGFADGALADAAKPAGRRQAGTPTMGEAIGAGAGRGEPGSGTKGDRGDLGGVDPIRVAE